MTDQAAAADGVAPDQDRRARRNVVVLALAAAPALRSVTVVSCRLQPGDLAPLRDASGLQRLCLRWCTAFAEMVENVLPGVDVVVEGP